jgi:hypothetical protein
MQNVFATMVMPFIIATAKSLLLSLAQNVWDGLWDLVFDSIKEIEIQIKNRDVQADKKKIILDRVEVFLTSQKKLSKVQRWAVMVFMGRVIDAMIKDLNENHGQNWIDKAVDLKKKFADKIPGIN